MIFVGLLQHKCERVQVQVCVCVCAAARLVKYKHVGMNPGMHLTLKEGVVVVVVVMVVEGRGCSWCKTPYFPRLPRLLLRLALRARLVVVVRLRPRGSGALAPALSTSPLPPAFGSTMCIQPRTVDVGCSTAWM